MAHEVMTDNNIEKPEYNTESEVGITKNIELTGSKLNLESDILYYVEQKFPDYYHNDISKPKREKIAHLSKLFDEFTEIGREKEKHNLKWAFRKANNDFNFEELQKVQPKRDCFIAYDDVVCAVNKQSKAKINNFSRRFSLLSMGFSLIDIAVSVLLILIVSLITHFGEGIFNTLVLSSLFIALVALIKVTLDRFAIMPVIDRYGWYLFNKTIYIAREEAIKLNAVYLVLIESIARKESVETRFNLIKKQKKELVSQRRILPLPSFLSPKPADN